MQKYIDYVNTFSGDVRVVNWIDTALTNYLKKHEENQGEIEHVLDYLSYEGTLDKIDLRGLQYEQARKNAEKWSKALSKKGRGIKEFQQDVEVIHDFKDGFKIVKLIGKSAYDREGAIMGHCVASYFGRGVEVYSLRDKDNVPHCTMEKDKQIKGRGNGDIHPRYIDYIVEFLKVTGMEVGDSEMKHLGYVNVEEVLKEELDLNFPELYKGKYFRKNMLDSVENKDRISLWNIFSLFEFDLKMGVKFNFNFLNIIENFQNKFKKTDSNKVAMTSYNKVAMTDSNKVAMTSYNKVAMTSSNKVAMTSYNKVAMTHSNKVAMTDSNEVAMTHSNEVAMTDSNKVAMTSSNEVAMTSYNEVAMTDSNKVAMTDSNVVAMCVENTINCGINNVIVVGNGSKVSAHKGSFISFFERDDTLAVKHFKSIKIDGKKYKENTFYHMVKGKVIEFIDNKFLGN